MYGRSLQNCPTHRFCLFVRDCSSDVFLLAASPVGVFARISKLIMTYEGGIYCRMLTKATLTGLSLQKCHIHRFLLFHVHIRIGVSPLWCYQSWSADHQADEGC